MEPLRICAVSVHIPKGDGTMPHKESKANHWVSNWTEVAAIALLGVNVLCKMVFLTSVAHQQDPGRGLDPASL